MARNSSTCILEVFQKRAEWGRGGGALLYINITLESTKLIIIWA